jgi:3-oxoacyl-[acyl-carrier protein] reductase
MPDSLAGRTAIVTGGFQGIGRAVAEALAADGARVTVCDVRHEVEDAASELRHGGLPIQGVVADVSDASDVRHLVDMAGPVDVVVNNAGIVRRTVPTDEWEKSITDFDDVIGTNLRGPFLVGRAVIPGMIARGGGDIVNVATDHIHTCGWPNPVDHTDAPDCPWHGDRRPPGGGPSMDLYDASKWGLHGLTQSWAVALHPRGIRVNSLCVGATDTAMLRSFLHAPPGAALVASWLRPAQVADVVLQLLHEAYPGRSGDSIGVWAGHPPKLPPPGPLAIT